MLLNLYSKFVFECWPGPLQHHIPVRCQTNVQHMVDFSEWFHIVLPSCVLMSDCCWYSPNRYKWFYKWRMAESKQGELFVAIKQTDVSNAKPIWQLASLAKPMPMSSEQTHRTQQSSTLCFCLERGYTYVIPQFHNFINTNQWFVNCKH